MTTIDCSLSNDDDAVLWHYLRSASSSSLPLWKVFNMMRVNEVDGKKIFFIAKDTVSFSDIPG